MRIDTNDLLNSMLKSLDSLDYIKSKDMPGIDLYMDQLTTFINNKMDDYKRYDDDKILTKTMINNYAKNQVLPAPEKKQYTREHMMDLIFIYYFKSVLSITDIQKVLDPIHNKYFGKKKNNLAEIYDEIFSMVPEGKERIKKHLDSAYQMSRYAFTDFPEDEREFLQTFTLICELTFEIYLRKMVLESLIDSLPDVKDEKEVKKTEKSREKNAAKAAKTITKNGSKKK